MGPTQTGEKVTVGSNVDDWMEFFPLKGVGGRAFKEHIFGNMPPNVH